jgi:hypothetical protein
MRTWRWPRALVTAAFAAALLTLAGSAIAAGGKGPAKAKIIIKGGTSFKPNAYIKDAVHFGTGTVVIRSGGQVTLTNTTSDPHSLSLVRASQLPRTTRQIENCAICPTIAKSHGVNPEGPPQEGPPPVPLANVGAVGFDRPGDSIVIGPKGHGGQVKFKVTARPGTVLHFMCVIHPWMQGRFLVK